jgi:DNA-binding HxlR family transcriptional regulator
MEEYEKVVLRKINCLTKKDNEIKNELKKISNKFLILF